MPNYAQIGEDNKVHTVQEIPNRLVEVEENDARLLGTIYNHETGEFIGYRINLTADKTEIIADGEDTATVTANVTTWDEQAGTVFGHEIIFEVNGQQISAEVVNGQAIFEFASNEIGTFTIKTVNNENTIMSNGSIEIEVIESGE